MRLLADAAPLPPRFAAATPRLFLAIFRQQMPLAVNASMAFHFYRQWRHRCFIDARAAFYIIDAM